MLSQRDEIDANTDNFDDQAGLKDNYYISSENKDHSMNITQDNSKSSQSTPDKNDVNAS